MLFIAKRMYTCYARNCALMGQQMLQDLTFSLLSFQTRRNRHINRYFSLLFLHSALIVVGSICLSLFEMISDYKLLVSMPRIFVELRHGYTE